MLKVYSTRAINQTSVIIEKYVLLPLKIFTTLSVSEKYRYIVNTKNDFLNEKG